MDFMDFCFKLKEERETREEKLLTDLIVELLCKESVKYQYLYYFPTFNEPTNYL